MSVRAEFDGTCPICEEPIFEGDEIVKLDDEDEWAHERCAEEEGLA